MTQEREAFEAWVLQDLLDAPVHTSATDKQWRAWNARASLEQPASVPSSMIDALWNSSEVMALNAELGLTMDQLARLACAILAVAPMPSQAMQDASDLLTIAYFEGAHDAKRQLAKGVTQPASVPALDKQAAFEAWLENYPIQIVGDDYELCSDAFDAGVLAASPQAPKPAQAVPDAVQTLIASMRSDPDYAWSWHCNVAMSFVDAGGDHYTANQGAARFMRLFAGVDPAYSLPAAPQPEAQPTFSIPTEIAKIIENLHTQDNRITANPLFAVQQKRVIGGLESGYEDGWAWADSDGEIHDADRISELNARFQDGEFEPDGCRRVGYIEKWEFVTGCLTEEGCKQYLRLDGHNLREPRIYAYGGYRNVELEALRKWLMSLRAAPSAQAEPQRPNYRAECWPESPHNKAEQGGK